MEKARAQRYTDFVYISEDYCPRFLFLSVLFGFTEKWSLACTMFAIKSKVFGEYFV